MLIFKIMGDKVTNNTNEGKQPGQVPPPPPKVTNNNNEATQIEPTDSTCYSNLIKFVASHKVLTVSALLIIAAGITAALIGFGAVSAGSGYMAFLTTIAVDPAGASLGIGSLGVSVAALTVGCFALYGSKNPKTKKDDLLPPIVRINEQREEPNLGKLNFEVKL